MGVSVVSLGIMLHLNSGRTLRTIQSCSIYSFTGMIGVEGLGLRDWGLGFRVYGLG